MPKNFFRTPAYYKSEGDNPIIKKSIRIKRIYFAPQSASLRQSKAEKQSQAERLEAIMHDFDDMFNPSFLKSKKSSIPSPLPSDATVAMAYVPFQQAPIIYEEEKKSLERGTLFPELDKPFTGKGVIV